MRPEAFVTNQGGAATRADLLKFFEGGSIDKAVLEGRIVKQHRNRYTLPGLPDDKEAAAVLGGIVSGLSAARVWGWSLKREPTRITVTVPRNHSGRTHGDVRVERRDVPETGRDQHITTRAQTVLDCARTLAFDEALCIADSALRDGWTTGLDKKELLDALALQPRTGRSRTRRVIEAADPNAANAFESVTRAIVLPIEGLSVAPQGPLGRTEAGQEMYGDLVDSSIKLLIECESWAFHAGQEPFRRDIRRYTGLAADGWTVLRFVWEDVMQKPAYVREVVERAVARISAHSSPLRDDVPRSA